MSVVCVIPLRYCRRRCKHPVLFRVLMLRREASPTDTDLHVRFSHMVNEALEMIPMESYPEETLEDTTQFSSTEAHAQP